MQNFSEKNISRKQMIRPSIQQKLETQKLTQKKLDKKINYLSYIHQKTSAGQINTKSDNKYIQYQKGNVNKLVRVQEMQQDPFLPPQYKAKRVPQGPRSPPEPLMRSPPKKLQQEELQEWKIPPCISAWKNTKGYLIPLDVRIEAQKYGKKVPKINDKFQDYTQALYEQEQKTKKFLEEKKKLKAAKQLQDLEEQERKLREKVLETKQEKKKIFQLSSDEENFEKSDRNEEEFQKRELVRQMIKKKVERDYKFRERNNLNKERDIYEKIALGEKVGDFKVQELEIDPKLEEMNAGLNSGYYQDTEIYDKPLFKERVETNIYSGVKRENNYENLDDEYLQLKKKNKNVLNARDQPVQFERSKPKIKKEQLIYNQEMCGRFFENKIPLSNENEFIIRPVGQYFITGLNNSYDENFPLGLQEHLTKSEFKLILFEINQILMDYWSCPASLYLGYFFAFFTFGLSLLLPYICIRETEKYLKDYLAILNYKILKRKNLQINLIKKFPVSYLLIKHSDRGNNERQKFAVKN